jgi:SAM-dependent methyltransferase
MSTKVFDTYSEYYDLLYRDKDYDAETNYVHALINTFHKEANSVLELGSGTGLHACLLAQLGYQVTGIDQSHTMLAKARARKNSLQKSIADKLSFQEGDVRTYKSSEKFDAVISLFHVMSYMETDADLTAAIHTAKEHLKKDGLFIFDCWHGPAVLHDKPVSRTKNFENENISVTRISTPELFPERNVVNVHFDISIKNKQTKEESVLYETHKMRYLFTEELTVLLNKTGLAIVCAEEWMTKQPLSDASWNACYICKNKD